MPRRNFLNIKDFEDYFADTSHLIIDATEQAIQRPSDKEPQKAGYSGKKRQTPESNDYFNGVENNKIY